MSSTRTSSGRARVAACAALFGVATAGAVALSVGVAEAGKPTGGGGGIDTGIVYFAHQGLTWTMNPDGSAKTSLPAAVRSEPSRALHGGHRWFLDFRATAGEFQPNGQPRYDLLAVRDDGALVTRLTYSADLSVHAEMRWSPGDAAVSWRGERWAGGMKVDAGIYVAGVVFDSNGDVTGLAAQPTSVSVPVSYSLFGHDWSPDATHLVVTDAASRLSIASLASGGLVPLGSASGSYPAWSPDGLQIAYSAGGIHTIAPDGTGDRALVSVSPKGDVATSLYAPSWSPNGTHLVYGQRSTRSGDRWDVYRVAASSSGKTNLTADLNTVASPATPVAWR